MSSACQSGVPESLTQSPRYVGPVRQVAAWSPKCPNCGKWWSGNPLRCPNCRAIMPSSGKQTGDIPVNAERVSEGRLPR